MGIVVGYLATPEGRAALGAAADEARMRDVPVVVVVSLRPDASPDERASLDAELGKVERKLTKREVAYEIRVRDGGDVADDLISAAEETGASLIVIGVRRRSPVGKLILGVNAQRVLFDAPCPVMTVKPTA
ncbi:universal stress protein [Cellulomonas composti]|uniref:Universal stress protein n=1 Tax=Cellulomonas composti TaxID=266130 RepID=A0A511J738_9CELL|nr:universal stress protein [Cellulomonas composti]GEL93794.1 universal stress protein [Cellulomonas composti]